MSLRQAAQQALEALEYADACLKKQLTTKTKHEYAQDLLFAAGIALKQALTEPESVAECERCEELGYDKATYYRLYELACIELQKLKKQTPVVSIKITYTELEGKQIEVMSCELGNGTYDLYIAPTPKPEQKPIDSSEKAGAYMDARLWEFIDMAAAWPKSRPDLRTWDHVMVYAPKQPEQEPVAWMCSDESLTHKGYSRFSRTCEGAWNIPVYTAPTPRKPLTDEEIELACVPLGAAMLSFTEVARAIERAHGIGK